MNRVLERTNCDVGAAGDQCLNALCSGSSVIPLDVEPFVLEIAELPRQRRNNEVDLARRTGRDDFQIWFLQLCLLRAATGKLGAEQHHCDK